MKKFGLFLVGLIVIMFIGVLLAGCSSKSNSAGLSDFMTVEDLRNFVEGDKSGFIFITSENDEEFEKQKAMVELALKENKATALSFHDYMADGKNRNKDGNQSNPYMSEMPSDSLIYVKDGSVVDTFNLQSCDCLDIDKALDTFVKKYKND